MKILLLSRYDDLGASSRYRSYQYLPYLEKQGLEITVAPLLDNNYIKSLYLKQKIPLSSIISSYKKRIFLLLNSYQYDLIWLEKESFPWIPSWLELLLLKSKTPYVVDYDDAVFHRYDQHSSPIIRHLLSKKIDNIMKHSSLVIVGNQYLAERGEKAGAKRIEILPTVIDLERYPIINQIKNDVFTIGWIGSPSTSSYLKEIQPSLKKICQKGNVKVIAIGASHIELDGVTLEIKPWSQDTEVKEMQQFDVGIMPLPNIPFTRGKCGFKLIQYMACCLPVIGSAIGANCEIISEDVDGFQVISQQDWSEALEKFHNNPQLRQKMGRMGRKKVEQEYSLQLVEPRLSYFLQKVVSEYGDYK